MISNAATQRSPLPAVGSAGFSLLEMLVVLVILSLSLVVLYNAATAAIRNARVAKEYSRAIILAESMLTSASYVTQEKLKKSGSFEEFSWEITSWPVEEERKPLAEQESSEYKQLQFLQVLVIWQGGSSLREIDLLTIVPLRDSVQ